MSENSKDLKEKLFLLEMFQSYLPLGDWSIKKSGAESTTLNQAANDPKNTPTFILYCSKNNSDILGFRVRRTDPPSYTPYAENFFNHPVFTLDKKAGVLSDVLDKTQLTIAGSCQDIIDKIKASCETQKKQSIPDSVPKEYQ